MLRTRSTWRALPGTLAVLLGVAGCASATGSPASAGSTRAQAIASAPTPSPTTTAAPASSPPWRVLAVPSPPAGGSPQYARLLSTRSMEAGVYRIPAGSTDAQEAHARDEVYAVLAGSATLVLPDRTVPVHRGTLAFVRAGVAHHFDAVTSDLEVVVTFAAAQANADDPPVVLADVASMQARATSVANIFDQFLSASTIRAGLYLLPRALGGDTPKVHAVDELNVFYAGSGRFHVGGDDTAVAPDDLVFVPAGTSHTFHDLSDDLAELILWPASP
jgi:mannose-6-phosphate isomerase-like protein (cupin superfamily)